MSHRKKKIIFVADDDIDILNLIKIVLENEGYNVVISINGLELRTLSQKPDMVFLDINMSGVDGKDICYQFKRNADYSTIPVVLLSADMNIGVIAAACGADGYVAKPFDINEIIEIASKHTNIKDPRIHH